MTKQITIKEDGVSKSESVDFINTQVAGGSADWMPEDEAQSGVFYVHANGEYVPSDYGFYGFYAVGVMVPGGNGAETIQPGSLTPTYVTPVPATGLGASVIGVDPTDGALYRTEIQDVDGVPTLVKTKVADSKADYKPTSMKILIKPAKLSYNAGNKIQYAGLVVQLLDSTGYTFVDERFPQGIISWSPVKNLLHPEYDLITPVEYAGNDGHFICPEFNWNYDNFHEMHIARQTSGPSFAYVDGVSAEDYTNFPVVLQKLNSSFTLTVHCIGEYAPRFGEPYTLDTYITYTFNVVDDFEHDIYVAAFSNKVLSSDSTDNIDAISVVFAFEPANTSENVINLEKNYDPHGHTSDYPFVGDEWKMETSLDEKPISHYGTVQTAIFALSAVLDNPPYKKYKIFNIESSPVPVNITSRAINKSLLNPYNGAAFYESLGYIGWDMVYGENRVAGRSIPVQWKSPYDNQTYEDTFNIEVEDA